MRCCKREHLWRSCVQTALVWWRGCVQIAPVWWRSCVQIAPVWWRSCVQIALVWWRSCVQRTLVWWRSCVQIALVWWRSCIQIALVWWRSCVQIALVWWRSCVQIALVRWRSCIQIALVWWRSYQLLCPDVRTKCMERSLTWDTDSDSARQHIPSFRGNWWLIFFFTADLFPPTSAYLRRALILSTHRLLVPGVVSSHTVSRITFLMHPRVLRVLIFIHPHVTFCIPQLCNLRSLFLSGLWVLIQNFYWVLAVYIARFRPCARLTLLTLNRVIRSQRRPSFEQQPLWEPENWTM